MRSELYSIITLPLPAPLAPAPLAAPAPLSPSAATATPQHPRRVSPSATAASTELFARCFGTDGDALPRIGRRASPESGAASTPPPPLPEAAPLPSPDEPTHATGEVAGGQPPDDDDLVFGNRPDDGDDVAASASVGSTIRNEQASLRGGCSPACLPPIPLLSPPLPPPPPLPPAVRPGRPGGGGGGSGGAGATPQRVIVDDDIDDDPSSSPALLPPPPPLRPCAIAALPLLPSSPNASSLATAVAARHSGVTDGKASLSLDSHKSSAEQCRMGTRAAAFGDGAADAQAQLAFLECIDGPPAPKRARLPRPPPVTPGGTASSEAGATRMPKQQSALERLPFAGPVCVGAVSPPRTPQSHILAPQVPQTPHTGRAAVLPHP